MMGLKQVCAHKRRPSQQPAVQISCTTLTCFFVVAVNMDKQWVDPGSQNSTRAQVAAQVLPLSRPHPCSLGQPPTYCGLTQLLVQGVLRASTTYFYMFRE
jgi:hypothetical protein